MFDLLNGVVSGAPDQPAGQISTIYGLGSIIVNTLLAVAFSMSTITLAYGFIQMTLAKGDPKLAEKARFAIEWSLIAIILTILAVGLKVAIFSAIGVQNASVNDPGF